MINIFCETERLIIRDIDLPDIEGFGKIFVKPNFYFHSTLNCKDSAREFVERAIDRRKLKHKSIRASFRMAILKKHNKKIVGYVGAGHVNPHPELVSYGYELGIFIDPAEQGNGYATEALSNFINHLKASYGLCNYYATVHPDNKPSIKLVEKINMSYQNMLDEALAMQLFEGPRNFYTLTI